MMTRDWIGIASVGKQLQTHTARGLLETSGYLKCSNKKAIIIDNLACKRTNLHLLQASLFVGASSGREVSSASTSDREDPSNSIVIQYFLQLCSFI